MNNLCALMVVVGCILLALATLGTAGTDADVQRAGVMAFVGLCWIVTAVLLRRPRGDRP